MLIGGKATGFASEIVKDRYLFKANPRNGRDIAPGSRSGKSASGKECDPPNVDVIVRAPICSKNQVSEVLPWWGAFNKHG